MTRKKTIKVYVAQSMTGKFCDEILAEARVACRALRNYGFEPLSPVFNEEVPDEHIPLSEVDYATLTKYWKMDKQMVKDAHIVLDLNSRGKSGGVNVELGYARFCLWKPTIRIYPKCGVTITKLEYDDIVENLGDALLILQYKYGSKSKLLKWRLRMLNKSLLKFLWLQFKALKDCF